MKNAPSKTPLSWNPIHPRRDWQRMFLLFVVLTVLIGIWSGYLFYRSEHRQEAVFTEQSSDESGVAKQIERISSFFEKRK